MALTEADLRRAQELAESAPALSAGQKAQLRAILTACLPAQAFSAIPADVESVLTPAPERKAS